MASKRVAQLEHLVKFQLQDDNKSSSKIPKSLKLGTGPILSQMLLGYVTPWPLVVIRDSCHSSERTTLFRELKPDLSIWFGSLSG